MIRVLALSFVCAIACCPAAEDGGGKSGLVVGVERLDPGGLILRLGDEVREFAWTDEDRDPVRRQAHRWLREAVLGASEDLARQPIVGAPGREWIVAPARIEVGPRVRARAVLEILQLLASGFVGRPVEGDADRPIFAEVAIVAVGTGGEPRRFRNRVGTAPPTVEGVGVVIEPPEEDHVRLVPAGADPGSQPSQLDAWCRDDPHRTAVAVMIGAEDHEVEALDLRVEADEATRAAAETGLREFVRGELATRPASVPLFLHAASTVPWEAVDAAWAACSELDRDEPPEIAPIRLADYHAWAIGFQLFELLHLR